MGHHPRSRSTRRKGKRRLDLAGRLDPASRSRACHCPVSRGGGDAAVSREFNLRCKDFVAGGFVLPEAKGGAEWLDRDTWLVSSALGNGWRHFPVIRARPGSGSAGRTSRRLRSWPRSRRKAWGSGRDPTDTQDAETIHFVERPSFYETAVQIGDRTGPKMTLALPLDIDYAVAQTGSRSSGEATGRSEMSPIRKAPCSGSAFAHFLPATGTSEPSSSPKTGACCKTFTGSGTGSFWPSWMT